MSEPVRVVVVMEGGVVQTVLGANVEYAVIDYDVDDTSAYAVPQGDGSTALAVGHVSKGESNPQIEEWAFKTLRRV